MYDLPYISSADGCACDNTGLEQAVREATQIYSGQVVRISKKMNGTYQVIIRAEETHLGDDLSGQTVRYKLTKECIYPFHKNHSYTFVLQQPVVRSDTLQSCDAIVNTADTETIQQIHDWLRQRTEVTGNPKADIDHAGTEPQPANEGNGARHIFESLTGSLASIKIEEEDYRTWLYEDAESLYFYSPGAKISFFVPLSQPITAQDFEQFIRNISVFLARNSEPVSFSVDEVSLELKELPIVIRLSDAPAQDIIIRFDAPDSEPRENEGYEVYVTYTTPFTYTVTSTADPSMDQYMELLKAGYQAVYHVSGGRSHSFVVRFSHPVDRSSVYERLNENFQLYPAVAWSLLWLNDYEVRLSLTPDDEFYETIQFNLNGIMSEGGYRLIAKEQIVIQTGDPYVFQSYDPETRSREVYFSSITPYEMIDVSPDGGYVLAAYRAHNGMHTVYQYVVFDRFGNLEKTFPIEEVHHPAWLEEGVLLLATENELLTYNLVTEETKVVWRTPGIQDDEIIVSLDHSVAAHKLAVGSGYTTDQGGFVYDLYVLDSSTQKELVRIEGFGTFECMEGRCFAPELIFTDNGRIMYNRWEAVTDGTGGYASVLYETDLDSLVTRRVNPLENQKNIEHLLFPLQDGSVLVIAQDVIQRDTPPESVFSIKELWSIYDPDSTQFRLLFETNLGLFANYWIDQIVPVSSTNLLLYIYGIGWYMVDIDSRQFMPYSAIDATVGKIDVESGRIWFLE